MTDRDMDMTDRMSQRFGSDENDEPSENSKSDRNEQSSKPSEQGQPSDRSGGSEPNGNSQDPELDGNSVSSKPSEPSKRDGNDSSELNVKEDWTGRYMYIPPAINKQFDDEYERLRYECGRDLDWKPKKNKHYYPVVATHGIHTVAEMDPEEFVDAITTLDWASDKRDDIFLG